MMSRRVVLRIHAGLGTLPSSGASRPGSRDGRDDKVYMYRGATKRMIDELRQIPFSRWACDYLQYIDTGRAPCTIC